MLNKHIEDFRKVVTAGTPVEAVARIYGLSKGSRETDAELSSRLEILLETAPDVGQLPSIFKDPYGRGLREPCHFCGDPVAFDPTERGGAYRDYRTGDLHTCKVDSYGRPSNAD